MFGSCDPLTHLYPVAVSLEATTRCATPSGRGGNSHD
jgi:hypothetical protein